MNNIVLLAGQNEQTGKLADELSRNNYSCTVLSDSGLSASAIISCEPDLVLIDLTSEPAFERVCREIKKGLDVPVLAIAPVSVVLKLDGQVNDFVSSISSIPEAVLRVGRLLDAAGKRVKTNQISARGLLIDPEKYEVYVNGRLVDLTFKEYELLKFLASNPGRVFTRDMLLNRVWGEDYFGGDRSVDVQIRRLRSKIEDNDTTFIDTVRNIGYRFKKT